MAARYSPIAPLPLLEQLQQRDVLGNYLLLLAHDVLDHPEGYAELIDHVVIDADDPFIVIDNGVIEKGNALAAMEVIEAASYVEANCIITPDVLGDFAETQKLVMSQAVELQTCELHLMKVPQGSNVGDLVKCVDWLREYLPPHSSDPDYWGIPRWIANQQGSRIFIIQYINAKCEDPKIHLLGMSTYLSDDLRCLELPGVIGIDSANPLVLGLAGRELSVTSAYMHMHRGNYWDCTRLDDRVIRNVEHMHELVR